MEEFLWISYNKICCTIDISEYEHVALSFIFLKYVGDHFGQHLNELIDEDHAAFADKVEFYGTKNNFYLSQESRWGFIMENAKLGFYITKPASHLGEME